MCLQENPMIITDEESKENKPICSSPVNGESMLTDNETGPSEHDNLSTRNSKSNDIPTNDESDYKCDDQQESNFNTSKSDNHKINKRMHPDKDDMLDANAVDGVTEMNKFINKYDFSSFFCCK